MTQHDRANISGLRQEYLKDTLDENNCPDIPFTLFEDWFTQALKASILEPSAMTLATVDADLQPQARTVLLKDWSENGFVFFTNYQSGKGQALEVHPKASLLFFWPELQRQIRIEGSVSKVTKLVSETYFHSRPLESQLGASLSPQSKVVSDRNFLDRALEDLKVKYKDSSVPLPEFWGGYSVLPHKFEFWQGRKNRLHDRIIYELSDKDWKIYRLAP